MTPVLESLYLEAMQLDPIDRAELLDRLFFSFSTAQNKKTEEKWRKEVEDRVVAFNEGKIQADTVDNVFKRLSKR
ncbi:MAG: addiction module protein [Candidatus Riflebacteria bacterium]|nr:addiction module protein [Candidatus Riflebacteria bacterium]